MRGSPGVERVHRRSTRPVSDTEWMDSAECRGSSIDFGSDSDAELATAQLICFGCQVRSECLNHALTRGEWAGVWGGLTPEGRRHVRDVAAVRR